MEREEKEKKEEEGEKKKSRRVDGKGRGRMRGWRGGEREGMKTDKSLALWVETGVDYAASLASK